MLVRQIGLLGDQKYSPQVVQFAKYLQAATLTALTKAVRQYAQDARYAAEGNTLLIKVQLMPRHRGRLEGELATVRRTFLPRVQAIHPETGAGAVAERAFQTVYANLAKRPA